MKKIKKAVIPVAGFGTRFLPATKAQPKEMLAIIDKPVIQYIVEEMVDSGIEEIILVTGQGKRAIEDHFDQNKSLEVHLERNNKIKELEEIRHLSEMAYFVYLRQKGPYGNATPVLNVEKLIGSEPFVFAFGDDLIKGEVPATKQMMEVFYKYQSPVIGVTQVAEEKVHRYGVIDGEKVEDRVYKVKDIVEKPLPKDAPSNLAVAGRYIFTPDIFEAVKKTEIGKGGELWLADAVDLLLTQRDFYAYQYQGRYYDCGNKLEFLKAIVDFALEREEFKEEFKNYLKNLKI